MFVTRRKSSKAFELCSLVDLLERVRFVTFLAKFDENKCGSSVTNSGFPLLCGLCSVCEIGHVQFQSTPEYRGRECRELVAAFVPSAGDPDGVDGVLGSIVERVGGRALQGTMLHERRGETRSSM